MKKIFCVLAWLNGVIGAGLMLLGGLRFFIGDEFLGVKNWENAFYPAYNFLLLAVLLLLASRGECKK